MKGNESRIIPWLCLICRFHFHGRSVSFSSFFLFIYFFALSGAFKWRKRKQSGNAFTSTLPLLKVSSLSILSRPSPLFSLFLRSVFLVSNRTLVKLRAGTRGLVIEGACFWVPDHRFLIFFRVFMRFFWIFFHLIWWCFDLVLYVCFWFFFGRRIW